LSEDEGKIRSMADLLRGGATLTDLSCPACSSPLFRLKNGDLWCAQCQKKVVVVKEGEQIAETESLSALGAVESTLLTKVSEINERMRTESDTDELHRLSGLLATLLENLEKVRRIARSKT